MLGAWSWMVRWRPSAELGNVRFASWDGDGRCLASATRGLVFWTGTEWRQAPYDGDPRAIRFVKCVGSGRWVVGAGDVRLYAQGGVHLVWPADGVTTFDFFDGALDDVAVIGGQGPGGVPMLRTWIGRRWLRPLPLPDASQLTSLSRVDDERWLVTGDARGGGAFAAIASPLGFQIERLATLEARSLSSSAGRVEHGVGCAAGAAGAALWWERGASSIESVGTKDLTAAAVDPAGRGVVAAPGKIWLRHGEQRVGAWNSVWDDATSRRPIVSLFADADRIVAVTNDAGMIEGRSGADMRPAQRRVRRPHSKQGGRAMISRLVHPRHVAAMTMCALLAFATTAHAQNSETERTALYRDGTDAADAGKWEIAAERFRRVVEIRSAPKALIALGIAEEHLGRLASAKRDYEKAVADARASQLADDEQAASRALAALTPRVPVLAVHVPNPGRVSDVTLDGKTIPTSDAEYSVDPGRHTIVAHGDSEFREVVEVKEGEHANVSVDVAARRPMDSGTMRRDVEPTVAASHGGLPVGAITLGIVGLVGIGLGSGLWAVGQGQENDVKAQCGGNTTNCPLSAKPEADSASTNIIAGDVVFVIGAVLAAVGTTWLVVSTLNHRKSAVTAWVTPAGLGVGARW